MLAKSPLPSPAPRTNVRIRGRAGEGEYFAVKVGASRNRIKAQRSGLSAERWACWLLRLKGYRILAVNWRCPAGEIDILARRGSVLAAIEVKRRAETQAGGADAGALLAISPRQQARIARAAEAFMARRADCRELTLRLDAITVLPGRFLGRFLPRLRHYPAAWQGDSA